MGGTHLSVSVEWTIVECGRTLSCGTVVLLKEIPWMTSLIVPLLVETVSFGLITTTRTGWSLSTDSKSTNWIHCSIDTMNWPAPNLWTKKISQNSGNSISNLLRKCDRSRTVHVLRETSIAFQSYSPQSARHWIGWIWESSCRQIHGEWACLHSFQNHHVWEYFPIPYQSHSMWY